MPPSVAHPLPLDPHDAAQAELDRLLEEATLAARYLPHLLPSNAAEERARLVAALERNDPQEPRWVLPPAPTVTRGRRAVDAARLIAGSSRAPALYLERLEELELELALVDSIGGDRRVIRRIAARRYGTGREPVPVAHGEVPLLAVADELLATFPPVAAEETTLPAFPAAPSDPSVAALMVSVARRAGVALRVRLEPRLSSRAAAGDGCVFLSPSPFGPNEALRLAAHEVLGHVVAAANGRHQPLRIASLGTAGSFEDQEGVALALEEASGLLDVPRLRALAGRVVATAAFHEAATFSETAWHLHKDHGFDAVEAITLAERTYRGGGVARDAAYLRGWLRVRRAVACGDASVDSLRTGRVSIASLPVFARLRREGLAVPPRHRPSLAYSLFATDSGTRRRTLPPNLAASFTTLELT